MGAIVIIGVSGLVEWEMAVYLWKVGLTFGTYHWGASTSAWLQEKDINRPGRLGQPSGGSPPLKGPAALEALQRWTSAVTDLCHWTELRAPFPPPPCRSTGWTCCAGWLPAWAPYSSP